eukprot:scaffold124336_cov63-Phaeocystis_antarctica.AAC.6
MEGRLSQGVWAIAGSVIQARWGWAVQTEWRRSKLVLLSHLVLLADPCKVLGLSRCGSGRGRALGHYESGDEQHT